MDHARQRRQLAPEAFHHSSQSNRIGDILLHDDDRNAASSDRVLRIARVVAQAARVLGAKDKAVRWMSTPNRAMGGSVPVEMLDTDLGTQDVEAALGRIGHGVFS